MVDKASAALWLKNDQKSALQQWLIQTVDASWPAVDGCVHQWLRDVRVAADTECMCVLQGKSLTADTTDLVFQPTKSPHESINTIKSRAHIIGSEISKLFRKVEKHRWRHVRSGTLRLSCQIRSLLHECNACLGRQTPAFSQREKLVLEECARLSLYVESHLGEADIAMLTEGSPSSSISSGSTGAAGLCVDTLLELITHLGHSFSSLVDSALRSLIQRLLETVISQKKKGSPGGGVVRQQEALAAVVAVGLEGEHMCYLLATEGGVQRLVEVCRDYGPEDLHSSALRALATICCINESINILLKEGGVGCVSDLLADVRLGEAVRAEAAGVVAQITSPGLQQTHLLPVLIDHLEDLVRSLTALCLEASSQEVFLLASAALANLTFLDSLVCDLLHEHHTSTVVIEAALLSKADSCYAKDQVATILSNMASDEAYWAEIIDNSGVELLVSLLEESTINCRSTAELAACERILQRSAIALTRLCTQADTAQIVVDMDGVTRFLELCQNPDQRNHSDAVLVACLAALRQIGASCHTDFGAELDRKNGTRISHRPLVDRLLQCSGLDESIV